MKKVVRISKRELVSRMCDNAYGRNYLIVSQDCRNPRHRFAWADDDRQYDPWDPGEFVAEVPAIDPEGSGRASEDAMDIIQQHMTDDEWETSKDKIEDYVAYAEKNYPDEWAIDRAEAEDWYAEAFVAALNGDTSQIGEVWRWRPITFEFGLV